MLSARPSERVVDLVEVLGVPGELGELIPTLRRGSVVAVAGVFPGPQIGRAWEALCEDDIACASLGIIMLTARGDEYDRLHGFEVGTDDYVVKPFAMSELVARIRALLRRARTADPGVTHMKFGDLEITDAMTRRILVVQDAHADVVLACSGGDEIALLLGAKPFALFGDILELPVANFFRRWILTAGFNLLAIDA